MFRRRTKLLDGPVTADRLREWLVEQLSVHLDIPVSQVDPDKDFESYGLDSRAGMQISGKLEKLLERRLSPAVVYEHTSINALVDHLVASGDDDDPS
ncbi:acyl carrier protein [Kibdelosporangium banguiense]|uniref:Acyl carrier protein n=1 Tax=Kibdelosporangium banguiense TaxID=1365924 RepID=A0ABS4TCM0_9PSEU|nr:acyl carrier protein [Kibdelosporangium banguiense]MBP2321593.1 acyl carrier protein [Kibdelosporangium banguiense]